MNEITDIAVIKNDIKYIKESNARIEQAHKEALVHIEKSKVSKQRFDPVEKITYALSGGVLIWVMNQLLNMITTVKALF